MMIGTDGPESRIGYSIFLAHVLVQDKGRVLWIALGDVKLQESLDSRAMAETWLQHSMRKQAPPRLQRLIGEVGVFLGLRSLALAAPQAFSQSRFQRSLGRCSLWIE
jgi:hypothetical protein